MVPLTTQPWVPFWQFVGAAFGPSGADGVPPMQLPGLAASLPKLSVLIEYCPSAGQGRRWLDAIKERMASSTLSSFWIFPITFVLVSPASRPGNTDTKRIAP